MMRLLLKSKPLTNKVIRQQNLKVPRIGKFSEKQVCEREEKGNQVPIIIFIVAVMTIITVSGGSGL